MALKLNNTENSNNQNGGGFVKNTGEQNTGRKMFQNKAANRALIIAGAVIGVLIIGCLILLAVPIG